MLLALSRLIFVMDIHFPPFGELHIVSIISNIPDVDLIFYDIFARPISTLTPRIVVEN